MSGPAEMSQEELDAWESEQGETLDPSPRKGDE